MLWMNESGVRLSDPGGISLSVSNPYWYTVVTMREDVLYHLWKWVDGVFMCEGKDMDEHGSECALSLWGKSLFVFVCMRDMFM